MEDLPPEETEERLRWLEAQAEKAYAAMYDAPFGSPAAAFYSDAKEFLYDAIALAGRLEKKEDEDRLAKRLEHIKQVFRSQFS